MKNIIEIENVSFSYTRAPVLRNVSLTVPEGEFLGIVGPNAGGKSTLIKLILGLLQPGSGTIRVLGNDPVMARSHIGYVPQYPTFSRRDFPINVMDTVLMGRLGFTSHFGGYSKNDREIATETIQAVEIADTANRPVGTLSGGQLQRVLIARALACKPEILILDEPTANIDMRVEEDIFGLLKHYNENMTIIVVSHDIGFISGYVDRVACLNQTLICHTTDEISGKTIEELYGAPVRMIHHSHQH
ncbi:MAG: ABC transporter [Gammaproteobacteria bacterium RIFCSPLOWO2_12_47_11]|nr:MAG: ABC transporter [Gammaproteobacteria bacterium RIFCSPLOWO2_12_47_11]